MVLKPEMVSINGTQAHTNAVSIGVVKGNLNYQEIAISPQTKRPRIIFEQNAGLSMVEPVDHILEAIDADKASKSKPATPAPKAAPALP